jgi:hypothetical protein
MTHTTNTSEKAMDKYIDCTVEYFERLTTHDGREERDDGYDEDIKSIVDKTIRLFIYGRIGVKPEATQDEITDKIKRELVQIVDSPQWRDKIEKLLADSLPQEEKNDALNNTILAFLQRVDAKVITLIQEKHLEAR